MRERLGTHVRQAGSYVGPDKLRFDFTHGERLSEAELADVESWIADRIAASHPVHALETTRAEAEALGAMALLGEKYGDWVRMVEIDAVSRELCGGTHVTNTAEIGLFHLLSETSSASNVRRIEAVTGRAGAELFRERNRQIRDLAGLLRVPEPDVVRAVERLSGRVKELQKSPGKAADRGALDELAAGAEELGGLKVVVEATSAPDAGTLLALSDTLRQRLGEAAVVLGCAVDDRVHLVANFAPAAVERGLRAGHLRGGGRDTMAQAGGRDPEKLPDALATARLEIERALS